VTFVAALTAVILVAVFMRAQTHNRVGADNVIEPELVASTEAMAPA
jgi:hypothetical protein